MKDRYVLALAAALALILTFPVRPWFPWWGELLFFVLGLLTLEATIEWAYKRPTCQLQELHRDIIP
jgi:hypothetical protein